MRLVLLQTLHLVTRDYDRAGSLAKQLLSLIPFLINLRLGVQTRLQAALPPPHPPPSASSAFLLRLRTLHLDGRYYCSHIDSLNLISNVTLSNLVEVKVETNSSYWIGWRLVSEPLELLYRSRRTLRSYVVTTTDSVAVMD